MVYAFISSFRAIQMLYSNSYYIWSFHFDWDKKKTLTIMPNNYILQPWWLLLKRTRNSCVLLFHFGYCRQMCHRIIMVFDSIRILCVYLWFCELKSLERLSYNAITLPTNTNSRITIQQIYMHSAVYIELEYHTQFCSAYIFPTQCRPIA